MATLNVRGQIFYIPGTWGSSKGVGNAKVQLKELDHETLSEATIFEGTTSADGTFQGTTGEWQRSVDVQAWVWDREPRFPDPSKLDPGDSGDGHFETKAVPDPNDILMLVLRVDENVNGQNKSVRVPYIHDPSNPTHIVVPWGPAVAATTQETPIRATEFVPQPVDPSRWRVLPPRFIVAKVNGQICFDPVTASQKLQAAADARQPTIILQVYDGTARDSFAGVFITPPEELQRRLRLDNSVARFSGWEWVVIILACAALVLAIGASIFIVLMGLAIIYAISKGYKPIRAEIKSDPNGSTYLEVEFGNAG